MRSAAERSNVQAALESALAALALGPEIARDDRAGIAAWLAQSGVSGDDAIALTRDFPRLLIYRQLVRRTLQDALRATLPRTVVRLGTRFDQDFSEFVRSDPLRSRYLRELTPAFLRFALPRWQADRDLPEYLPELAQHEALQVEMASLLARPKSSVDSEIALEQGIEFIDAARVVHYDWAVHRLPESETSGALPERGPVSLLVYRSPEHDVRYLELGPFAQALLNALLAEKRSLRDALGRAAKQVNQALDDELLTRAARLLAELAERGALLGKSSVEAGASAFLLP